MVFELVPGKQSGCTSRNPQFDSSQQVASPDNSGEPSIATASPTSNEGSSKEKRAMRDLRFSGNSSLRHEEDDQDVDIDTWNSEGGFIPPQL